MTLSEFKAWFEGFTEGIEKAPTEKQFKRIKAKVAEITGTPISYPVYIDRYVRPWRPYWDHYWSTAGDAGGTTTVLFSGSIAGHMQSNSHAPQFDSHAAMRELGRVEATIQ